MSDLPPLPEDDDPWVLLDVARSADERELKRAYARRIKVFRPDRAPEEFARIHAAYESLQRFARYRARVATAEAATETEAEAETATAAEPLATDPPATAPIVPRPNPVARPRVARVRASIDELAARGVTWREVAAWDEPERAARAWLAALRLRLRDPARHAEVKAMIEEPALLADVDHDEAAALVALSAVSALAWHGGAGGRLFRHLGKIPRHPLLEVLRDRAMLDLELGQAFRALPDSIPLTMPESLRVFLRESSLVPPVEHAAMREALYDDLARDLDDWIQWVRVLYGVHHTFAHALTERLLENIPPPRRVLGALPTSLRLRLGARLRAVKSPLILFMPYFILTTVAVIAAYVIGGERVGEPTLWGSGFVGLGTYLFERRRYRTRVRVALARIIVDLGVTRAAVAEWLSTFPTRAFRLAPYRMFMPTDHEMRLLSFLAAATHPDDRRPRAAAAPDAADDEPHADEDDGADDEDGSLIRPDDENAPRGPLRRFFDWFNGLPFVK